MVLVLKSSLQCRCSRQRRLAHLAQAVSRAQMGLLMFDRQLLLAEAEHSAKGSAEKSRVLVLASLGREGVLRSDHQ